MLCVAAGPGTGVFAAKTVWPSITDVVLVEQSRSMSQVAEHLLYETPGVMYRRSMADVHRYACRAVVAVVLMITLHLCATSCVAACFGGFRLVRASWHAQS